MHFDTSTVSPSTSQHYTSVHIHHNDYLLPALDVTTDKGCSLMQRIVQSVTKFCSHLKDFLSGNNRCKCVAFSTLFLNSKSVDMGTDPDHINPESHFCTHFRLFELSCKKFSSVTHRCSANIILHILLTYLLHGAESFLRS